MNLFLFLTKVFTQYYMYVYVYIMKFNYCNFIHSLMLHRDTHTEREREREREREGESTKEWSMYERIMSIKPNNI